MESLAFIITISPKHYNYIYNLIDITRENPEYFQVIKITIFLIKRII